MIFSLRKDPLMCLGGRYYETAATPEGTYFEYEPMTDLSKSRDATIRNLIVSEGSTAIRTNWDLPFRKGAYVTLADSNTYLIESVTVAPASTAFQSLAVCTCPDRDKILSVRLVANLRGGVL